MLSRKNRKSRNANENIGPTFETLERRELMSVTNYSGKIIITGTAGNDAITVTQNNDKFTVTGASASAQTFRDVWYLSVSLGDGNDTFIWDCSTNGGVSGGNGNDTITFKRAAPNGTSNIANGDAGDDILTGSPGPDELHGGAGNDYIYGGAGIDVIYGDAGVDHIYGQGDTDVITVYGDHTTDYVDGGDGWDKCYYEYNWFGIGTDRLTNVEYQSKN